MRKFASLFRRNKCPTDRPVGGLASFWPSICRAVGEDPGEVYEMSLHRRANGAVLVSLVKKLSDSQDAMLHRLDIGSADFTAVQVEVTDG